jgi:Rrf2 family iron-sulfur cluster assembly transcriptional regulator
MAIQAVLYITNHPDVDFIPIKKIATETDLSFHFLGKILQNLTRKGILNSYKGPNGGVCLAKSPDEITLLDIVEAMDGLDFYSKCLIGLPKCSDDKSCAVHGEWRRLREDIYRLFQTTKLSMLIAR